MDRAGLRPGEEGRLADVAPRGTPHIPGDEIAQFTYNWIIYREGFAGRRIIEQAQRLAWTAAPAA